MLSGGVMHVAPTASVARALSATSSPCFLPSSASRRPSVLRRRGLNPATQINVRTTKQKQSIITLQKPALSISAAATELSTAGDTSPAVLEVAEIKERCRKWQWKGRYSINYFVQSPTPPDEDERAPLLLVHGFGASIPHWRKNILPLAQHRTVYAVDLLGFGLSEKPAGFQYTMESWSELILDFLNEVVQKPAILVGNSVGSLACVVAAASEPSRVRGLVLLNCAGGMNNKAIVDDWRIKLFFPLLWLIDFLLKQKAIASAIFERVKQRENLRNVLSSVYGNKDSVDDTLVDIIKEPADDEGALDAFVSIVTGPPGPSPIQLMPDIVRSMPVLILWGDQDPFTPLDGPVGKYFTGLAANEPNVTLIVLNEVGHCPHDDRPELVHEKLLPWLHHLSSA